MANPDSPAVNDVSREQHSERSVKRTGTDLPVSLERGNPCETADGEEREECLEEVKYDGRFRQGHLREYVLVKGMSGVGYRNQRTSSSSLL